MSIFIGHLNCLDNRKHPRDPANASAGTGPRTRPDALPFVSPQQWPLTAGRPYPIDLLARRVVQTAGLEAFPWLEPGMVGGAEYWIYN